MQVAVLSPHRDDAAFSCGLTLSKLLQAGSTLIIVNVCTISRYAPYFTLSSGDITQRVTELRRKEDADFVESLYRRTGADNGQVEFVDLEWQDVPLRWQMEDERALAPTSLPPDEIRQLRDAFRGLPQCDLVLAPMALGGHIDHRLVQQAACEAYSTSSLVFYEDLPYACRMPEAERGSFELPFDLVPSELWLPEHGSAGGSKLEYALCYPSQIAFHVAAEMESYAADHGGRERFLAGSQAANLLMECLLHEVAR